MNALIRFRAANNLSQYEAAEHCQVSERSWRQWEKDGKGPRNPATKERLRQRGVIFEDDE